MNHPEIGEELFARDLETGTVVVMIGTHRPSAAMTMWVYDVTPEAVAFMAHKIHHALILRTNAKGELFDDQNHRIAIHKYLGEI